MQNRNFKSNKAPSLSPLHQPPHCQRRPPPTHPLLEGLTDIHPNQQHKTLLRSTGRAAVHYLALSSTMSCTLIILIHLKYWRRLGGTIISYAVHVHWLRLAKILTLCNISTVVSQHIHAAVILLTS